jgi:hypothetical protein
MGVNEGEVSGSALARRQMAAQVPGQVSDGITLPQRRNAKFRRSASGIRIVSLVLAVASTIILGPQLNFWAGLEFSFVAVGTLVSAVEPFFNWRSGGS